MLWRTTPLLTRTAPASPTTSSSSLHRTVNMTPQTAVELPRRSRSARFHLNCRIPGGATVRQTRSAPCRTVRTRGASRSRASATRLSPTCCKARGLAGESIELTVHHRITRWTRCVKSASIKRCGATCDHCRSSDPMPTRRASRRSVGSFRGKASTLRSPPALVKTKVSAMSIRSCRDRTGTRPPSSSPGTRSGSQASSPHGSIS